MGNIKEYIRQLKEKESVHFKNYFISYKDGLYELIDNCLSIVKYHHGTNFAHMERDPIFVDDKKVPILLEEAQKAKKGQIFFQMSRNVIRPVEASRIEYILCSSDVDVSLP